MKKILLPVLLTLAGCTSLSTNVQLVTEGNETSEVLVYRESSFHAGAVSLYVGENDKYFMKLRNGQYSKATIDSGKHVLQAKADASPASKIDIELMPGQTLCLKAEPNPDTLGAILIPILGNMLPTFLLTQVDCPTEPELSEYVLSQKS